jgi:dethiobiotin synthetase
VTASYFVTGTDTGVGKTFVATGILAACRRRGLEVAALKPAESGCRRTHSGDLEPADGLALRAAAGLEAVPIDVIVPNRYELPVAPAVAARAEKRPFSLARVVESLAALRSRAPRLLLVEGAGGLLVPYDDHLLGADLAAQLALPLLIVARAGLGTINHTLLTLREAERRGLRVAAVILNQTAAVPDPSEPTNAREIERIGGTRVLGPVPYSAGDKHDVVGTTLDVRALL